MVQCLASGCKNRHSNNITVILSKHVVAISRGSVSAGAQFSDCQTHAGGGDIYSGMFLIAQ